jgi:hypothetical protein
MPSNEDFAQLAIDLRSLPSVQERVSHLIETIRHEMDMARSSNVWDNVHGVSQLLGLHADAIAAAVGVDRPVEEPKLPLRGGKPQTGSTGL